MSIRTLAAALIVSLLLGNCNGNGNETPDGAITQQDTGGTSGDGTLGQDGPQGGKTPVGDPCTTDDACESSICVNDLCRKPCAESSDCEVSQDCNTDDDTRLFCIDRTYDAELGTFCGLDGKCPNQSLNCIGGLGYASAYCTGKCETSLDCPPQYFCRELSDGDNYCIRRSFCSRCLTDEMCTSGRKCVLQGTEKFCTKTCTPGSTECPVFANCTNVDGDDVCVHKAGSCVGTRLLCDPCITEDDCGHNAMCLTYIFSDESFCGQDCSSTGTCPTGYACVDIDVEKQCVPDTGSDPDATPTCVDSLSPTMMPGDIMDDFSMVGYVDTDNDGSLVGETLQVIKLSQFKARYKLIMFNISAGWCGPCQSETQYHATLMNTYENQGLMIFQVLFDSDIQGDKPTIPLLDAWVSTLNAAGAVGIDPARNCLPYNTEGTTPMNMFIDAKTLKVLEKVNGLMTQPIVETKIKGYLGIP